MSVGADEQLTYNAFNTLFLQTGAAADIVKIQGTALGTSTNVATGGGDDSIIVSSSAGTGLAGNVQSINGQLLIDACTGSANSLLVDDSTDQISKTVSVDTFGITGLAPQSINFAATGGSFTNGLTNDGILIKGSNSKASIFNIQSTLAVNTTKIVGGAGDDVFTVSNNGDTAGIAGHLTIEAGAGTANRLVVDDSVSAAAEAVVISSTTISGLSNGTAQIDYAATGGSFTNGASNDGILIKGGIYSNGSYAIVSTLAGSATMVVGGNADDTFSVGSVAPAIGGNLNAIGSILTISGQGGVDSLNIDDTADTVANTGTLTATELTGLGMTGKVVYDTVENLEISLGSGSDTFTVNSTHAGWKWRWFNSR